jgi:predicted O-methyltransferase YrrM
MTLKYEKIKQAYADAKTAAPAVIVTLLLSGSVAWFVDGTAGVLVGIAAALGFTLRLLIVLHRRRWLEEQGHRRHMQALMYIYDTIKPRAPLPAFVHMAASPELVTTLMDHIVRHRPRTILELGSGSSTIAMAYALEQKIDASTDRLIYSLDHDERYAAATREQLAYHGLEAHAKVYHAPLREMTVDGRSFQWYDLDALPDEHGSIDMVLVDGPPTGTNSRARFPALPALYDRLSPSAIIVVDDANRRDETAMVHRWLEMYDGFRVKRFLSPKGTTVLYRSEDAS